MGEYMEDTNQDTGVSLDELANALPDDAEADEVEATDSEADDSQDDADDGMVDAEYDGKTYRLPLELKDALNKLLNDQEMVKDLTRNGKKFIGNHPDWDDVGNLFQSTIRENNDYLGNE